MAGENELRENSAAGAKKQRKYRWQHENSYGAKRKKKQRRMTAAQRQCA
jgi:hypothetical protein